MREIDEALGFSADELSRLQFEDMLRHRDRFLSEGFWRDRSLSGLSQHTEFYGYELWITPSNQNDSWALRICPNQIEGEPHEWGFDFASCRDAREAAWDFLVRRESRMRGVQL